MHVKDSPSLAPTKVSSTAGYSSPLAAIPVNSAVGALPFTMPFTGGIAGFWFFSYQYPFTPSRRCRNSKGKAYRLFLIRTRLVSIVTFVCTWSSSRQQRSFRLRSAIRVFISASSTASQVQSHWR